MPGPWDQQIKMWAFLSMFPEFTLAILLSFKPQDMSKWSSWHMTGYGTATTYRY